MSAKCRIRLAVGHGEIHPGGRPIARLGRGHCAQHPFLYQALVILGLCRMPLLPLGHAQLASGIARGWNRACPDGLQTAVEPVGCHAGPGDAIWSKHVQVAHAAMAIALAGCMLRHNGLAYEGICHGAEVVDLDNDVCVLGLPLRADRPRSGR